MQGLIDWVTGIPPLLGIAVLTFVPTLELRASIPYGILVTDLPWYWVFIAAVLINWAVAPLVYFLLHYVVKFLLRIGWFARLWQRYTDRTQQRIHRSVETWGAWGLVIFIGIPLPGSGVYTGALGAYLLGMEFRRFIWVALGGVVIAAVAVTLAVTLFTGIGEMFYSMKAVGQH